MASLRDVLNNAGKKIRLTTGDQPPREGLAMRRADVLLLEPRLEPKAGDVLEFVDSGERFRVTWAEPQSALEKVDHYRARVEPAPRG